MVSPQCAPQWWCSRTICTRPRLYAEAVAAGGFDVLVPWEDENLKLIRTVMPLPVTVDIGANGAGYTLGEPLSRLSPRPPLIAVTGRNREELPNPAPFDVYLVKPCLPERLVPASRARRRHRCRNGPR